MDLSFLNEYMMPVVFGLCLCVGYIIKHWIKDVDNKIIPTVCAIIGVLAAMGVSKTVSVEIILAGMLSGLASTGFHQVFKQLFGQPNI